MYADKPIIWDSVSIDGQKKMTANELAAHFEVSKRTILRDIDVLSMEGIPIYTAQGNNGGISILDKFVIDRTVISEDDQQQILLALQSIAVAGHIDTKSVLGRLRGLFENLDKDWIEVELSRWGSSETDRAKFDLLKNSIINECAISFAYSSSCGEPAVRKSYPLKLVFRSRSWYLQTFCLLRNDYRTFKINRMSSVEILEDRFEREKFHTPNLEHFKYSSPLINIRLHFMPHVAYRAYDEFDERDIIKNEDGSLSISVSLPNDQWLYNYILSLGTAVEVLEPQNVREEIVRQINEIKNKYLI